VVKLEEHLASLLPACLLLRAHQSILTDRQALFDIHYIAEWKYSELFCTVKHEENLACLPPFVRIKLFPQTDKHC
jgi:hypothetical protein